MSEILNKTFVYMGPEGSFSEIAAYEAIDILQYSDFNLKILPYITSVIEAVDKNNNLIGVVPIENSIEGVVRETVDNLIRTTSRVTITKEIIIPVSHCLISKRADKSGINKIISHTQAIAQCKNYLSRGFPEAEIIFSSSTSEGVRQLNDLPDDYAAIGTDKAASIYNLNIIEREINDEKDNLTRFILLGAYVPEPTRRDKTSIAISLCNKPGSLADMLMYFKEGGLNLSYIESRPSKRVFG